MIAMKVLQVVLALSVLIFLHELGHFLFARMFGIRVEKFYLFFDISDRYIFSSRRSRWFTRIFPRAAEASTDFGIGWLPLGGYCKISGMIDESMDLESMKGEPQAWEFRTHPAWQRLLVMSGGVLFNFLTAFVIFALILHSQGQMYLSNEGNAIYVNEVSYDMGFRTGDHILMYDDWVPEDFTALQSDLARRGVKVVTVLRGEDTVRICIDRASIGAVLNTPGIFDLAVPFVIDSIPPGSPNAASSLARGDRIIALGGTPVEYVQDSREVLSSYAGAWVDATVLRDADTLSLALQVDSLSRIGVFTMMPQGVTRRDYTLLESIPAGIAYGYRMIVDYVRDLRLVATPSTGAYKSVGSFISIGQVFPDGWDWLQIFYIMAMLSVMLGVMNLLPIPGLDGGHIMFTLYEMISGRKPSDRFMAAAQMVGMLLLLLLMFLAFGNDISKTFFR